jgi:phage tail sheath protein FI
MAYLHPGVYVEEIPSGSKPIEGVATSTAAFIGYTTKGPMGEPNLITRWDDYVTEYGGVRDEGDLAEGDAMGLSVSAFYQNGGTKAYIVRIAEDWSLENPAVTHAEKAVGYVDNPEDTGTGNALKFTAVNEGSWANGLVVRLTTSPIDSSQYDVEIGRNDDKGEFSAIETFPGVSLDSNDPLFIKNVIDDVSTLVTVKLDTIPTEVTADEFVGTSTSGDLSGLSLPLDLSDTSLFPDADSRTLTITIDGATAIDRVLPAESYASLAALAEDIQSAVRSGAGSTTDRQKNFTCVASGDRLVLTSGTRKPASSVVVTQDSLIAKTLKLGQAALTGTSTSGEFAPGAVVALSGLADTTLDGSIDGTPFTTLDLGGADLDLDAVATAIDGILGLSCSIELNRLVLKSDTESATSSVEIDPGTEVAALLQLGAANGGTELNGQEYHDTYSGAEATGQENAELHPPSTDTLDGGTDGNPPGEADYEKVFTQFIKYRDINIICLPGQHWSEDSSGNPVIQKAIGHAEKMKNRMVIVDPPPGHELDNAKKVVDMGLPSQTYCVVYYPWPLAANRFYHPERAPGLPKNVLVPPSGYAAGMWAKIDGKRGVWKAPAGMETGLLGLSKLQYVVEDDEQDALNPLGVNCLRSMPGAGKVIWGARTRATKADPEWRYVPVRRTAIMIEQSIYEGIQWAVFEPNDHRLWSALRGNIGGFMNSLFRVGAFQGEKASDAYFVRCGLGDTMTQAEIDAGQVIVIVGFAPLKPAEFVIVRIQQKVNQQ